MAKHNYNNSSNSTLTMSTFLVVTIGEGGWGKVEERKEGQMYGYRRRDFWG